MKGKSLKMKIGMGMKRTIRIIMEMKNDESIQEFRDKNRKFSYNNISHSMGFVSYNNRAQETDRVVLKWGILG